MTLATRVADGSLASSRASAASRGGRTTVTVHAASAATLAETLPGSERNIVLCPAQMMM